jgi:hypothetical protein
MSVFSLTMTLSRNTTSVILRLVSFVVKTHTSVRNTLQGMHVLKATEHNSHGQCKELARIIFFRITRHS